MTTTAAVILAIAIILTVGLILEFLVRCWELRKRWRTGPGWYTNHPGWWFKR